MIKDLNLSNSILTWDAINTRAATLKAVAEADADFLVCLKSNQGYLYKKSVTPLPLQMLTDI